MSRERTVVTEGSMAGGTGGGHPTQSTASHPDDAVEYRARVTQTATAERDAPPKRIRSGRPHAGGER